MWAAGACLLFLCAAVFSESTKLSTFPNFTVAIEGQSTTLYCYADLPIIHCDWLKGFEPETQVVTEKTDNYRLIGNRTSGECHLLILRTDPNQDDSVWRCRVLLSEEDLVLSDYLKLRVRATFVGTSLPPSIKPGVVVGITCALALTVGGLITIYLYKRRQPCFLAPSGFTSRSMLIVPPVPEKDKENCYDNEGRSRPTAIKVTKPSSEPQKPSC